MAYQNFINQNCNFVSVDEVAVKRYGDQACYSTLDLVNENETDDFVTNAPEIVTDYCLNTNNLDIFRNGSDTLIPKDAKNPNKRWSMVNYPFFYSKVCQRDLSSKFLLTPNQNISEKTTTQIKNFCGRFPVFQKKDADPLFSTNVAPYSGILNMNNFDFDSKALTPPQPFVNFNLFGAGTSSNPNPSFNTFKSIGDSSLYANTIGLRIDNPDDTYGTVSKPILLKEYSKSGILYMRRDVAGVSTLLQNSNLTYYDFLYSYFTSFDTETTKARPLGTNLRFMIRTDESKNTVTSDQINKNPTLPSIKNTNISSENSFSFITGTITGIDQSETNKNYFTGFTISDIYVSSPRALQVNFGCINYTNALNPFGTNCQGNDTSDNGSPSNGFNWYQIPDPKETGGIFENNRGISFLFDIYGFFDSETSPYYTTSNFLKTPRPLTITYTARDYTTQPSEPNKIYTIVNLFPEFDGEVPLTYYNTASTAIYDLCTCNLDGGTSQNPAIYRNFYTTFVANLNTGTNAYQQIYQDVNSSGTSTIRCIFPRCSVSSYPSSEIINNFSNPPTTKCKEISCIQIIEIDSTGSFSGNVNAFNECNQNSPNTDNTGIQSEIDKVIISFSVVISIVVLVGIALAIVFFLNKKK